MSRTKLNPPYTITIKVDAEGNATTSITAEEIEAPPPDHLSDHFSWTEVTYSDTAIAEDIDNSPSDAECNVIESHTAPFMEAVRTLLGSNPIQVSSWYRCEALNVAVGGSPTSEHRHGRAVDFGCPMFGTPYQVCATLAKAPSLPFNQLIYENHGGSKWVHISCVAPGETPRREVLTINSSGTHPGLVA